MSITIAIILNIILLNIRLRIGNNILHIFKFKKKIILQSVYFGAAGAGAIYLYPRILQKLELLDLSFTSDITFTTGSMFIVYLLGRTLLFIRLKQKKIIPTTLKILSYFIIVLLIGIILNTIFKTQGRELASLFFLIIASAEERVKRVGSYSSFKKYHINTTDMTLFAILVALGFSFWENILLAIDGTNSLVRIPMYIIHSVFSAIIAYSIYKGQKEPRHEIRTILGILVAVWGHTRYNSTIGKTNLIISISIGLLLYYAIAGLLYKSDSIYLTK